MIALACDHGGFNLMKDVISFLDSKKYDCWNFGTLYPESCDYPTIVVPAVNAIANNECERGILICGTGIGCSIAANKIRGIRAALCTDCYMAEMARKHNDANVLVLGARVVDPALAVKIVKSFLTTDFSEDERHIRRIAMLSELDNSRK